MSRALAKIGYCVCIASVGAVLSGCAETTYPTLPDLSPSNTRLLTPTEQQKAIRDIGGERSQVGETEKPQ